MLKKRVEVLFDPAEYRRLEEIARSQQRSVGSIVREAVEKYVVRPTDEERRKAFEWLLSQEMDIESDWEKVKEEIAQARDEQLTKSLEAD